MEQAVVEATERVEDVSGAEGVPECFGDDVTASGCSESSDSTKNVLGVKRWRGGLVYFVKMAGYVWQSIG